MNHAVQFYLLSRKSKYYPYILCLRHNSNNMRSNRPSEILPHTQSIIGNAQRTKYGHSLDQNTPDLSRNIAA
jgi:hypothetical protein